MTTNLSTRARLVSNIFDILAWVVLIAGGLVTVASVIAAFGSDNVFGGLMLSAGIAAYTVVSWAGVQLASLVAGYIEGRS